MKKIKQDYRLKISKKIMKIKKVRIKKVDYCPKFPYKVQVRVGWFKWVTKCHCANEASAIEEYNKLPLY